MSSTTDPNIFTNILSKKAYIADYEKQDFTVTWSNWDGSTLKTEAVGIYLGATPPTATPTKEDATFTGWLPSDYSYITASTSIVAQFKDIPIITFTVTWSDYDNSELKTEIVRSGKSATPPSDPTRAGYRFDKWDKAYDVISSNTTIQAQYIKVCTVTYKNWDGTVLKTQTVDSGGTVTPPVNPTKVGSTFVGWSHNGKNITSDTDIVAIYTDIKLEVCPYVIDTSSGVSKEVISEGRDSLTFLGNNFETNLSIPHSATGVANKIKIAITYDGALIPISSCSITFSNTVDYVIDTVGNVTRLLDDFFTGPSKSDTMTVEYNGVRRIVNLEYESNIINWMVDWSIPGTKGSGWVWMYPVKRTLAADGSFVYTRLNLTQKDYVQFEVGGSYGTSSASKAIVNNGTVDGKAVYHYEVYIPSKITQATFQVSVFQTAARGFKNKKTSTIGGSSAIAKPGQKIVFGP